MIYSFGDINIDMIWDFQNSLNLNTFPNSGNNRYRVGGVAYNLAITSQEFGENSCVIGKIGEDVFGRYIIEEIKKNGLNNLIKIDPKGNTCIMMILSFHEQESRVNRFMTYNTLNANKTINLDDIQKFNIRFKLDDILYLTGYSLFDPTVYPAAKNIIELAQNKQTKVIFDLLPHNLNSIDNNIHLLKLIESVFSEIKINLCIGEFKTWYYLLFGEIKNAPDLKDIELLVNKAKIFSDYICIRYGFENCEVETLYYKENHLYSKNTDYKSLSQENKIAYGDKLSFSLIQQLFLKKHIWIHDSAEKFTTPLSSLDLIPNNIRRDSKILDIGCGYGRAFEKLGKMGFRNVFGIDPSLTMVKKANENYPNFKSEQSSLKSLKNKNNNFDICLLLGVITTVQNNSEIELIFKQISEILNKNGLLVISDFLINNEDKYSAKYTKYKNIFPESEYGTFFSENGAVNRHFKKEYLYKVIQKYFSIKIYKDEIITTVNNNITCGFSMLCQKKNKP